MSKSWLGLAVLALGTAWGQAPAYTASALVNASDYTAQPFAPNSVVSIFGTNLAWSERALMASDIVNQTLPIVMNGVSVYVDNSPAPLLYVSPTQINFIVPGSESTGTSTVRVVREGVTGPEAVITLNNAAPAVFPMEGYAIATHADGSLLTEDAPAHGSDIIVIYATGLGKTQPNFTGGQIPQTAASIVGLGTLQVLLDGKAVDPDSIIYAGVTPLSPGLYQINLRLPADTGTDPEIRIQVGSGESAAGVKLMIR